MKTINAYLTERLHIGYEGVVTEVVRSFLGDSCSQKALEFCDKWISDKNIDEALVTIYCWKDISYNRLSDKIKKKYDDIEVIKRDSKWEKIYPGKMNGGPGADESLDNGDNILSICDNYFVVKFYDTEEELIIWQPEWRRR